MANLIYNCQYGYMLLYIKKSEKNLLAKKKVDENKINLSKKNCKNICKKLKHQLLYSV